MKSVGQFRLVATLLVGLAFSVNAKDDINSQAELNIDRETLNRIADQTAKDVTQKLLNELIKNKKEDLKNKKSEASTLTKGQLKSTESSQLMSIGTGSIGGNYFVLGELVGGVISHPQGSLPCGKGGTCGVNNLQSLNITSAGSTANIAALSKGDVVTGFVQSDVAYWAYTGTGIFENKEKMSDLRAIASLYPEAIHIVVRKDKNIKSLKDLTGKRVSLGARKSGTLSQARLVLNAYNMGEDDLQVEFLNNQQGIEKLKDEQLDAMFFTVGAPAPSLTQLFTNNDAFTLLSIDERAKQGILSEGYYFSPHTIKGNSYPGIGKVETVSVHALWLCSAKTDKDLVYQMTKALWSKTSRQLFDSSYIGRQVTVEKSLQGIGIPLHKGAKEFYNEIGKRY